MWFGVTNGSKIQFQNGKLCTVVSPSYNRFIAAIQQPSQQAAWRPPLTTHMHVIAIAIAWHSQLISNRKPIGSAWFVTRVNCTRHFEWYKGSAGLYYTVLNQWMGNGWVTSVRCALLLVGVSAPWSLCCCTEGLIVSDRMRFVQLFIMGEFVFIYITPNIITTMSIYSLTDSLLYSAG